MRFFLSRLTTLSVVVAPYLFLLLAIGCGSSNRKISTIPTVNSSTHKGSVSAQNAESDTLLPAADSMALSPADSAYDDPSELIEEAKFYCSEGEYDAADSTLKEAVKSIGSIEGESENGEWLPAKRFIDEIVNLYKEKMPDSYSIPDEITMAVFQQQMLRSIDSMNIMPSESLSQAVLLCQKGITYDVPMVWNDRVQRALFFYLRCRESTVDRWFFRANYYLPMMRQMFANSGLPQDLAYLPLIESGFNPLAYSYAHASGIWQFIASTGQIFGLKRTFWTDERRDPIRSTQAAIRYLRKLYNDFNNWHLALAAYNCGENGVTHALSRNKTNDFWSLKKLPRQTKNYVPFYLAALTIAKNPRCFGVTMPPVGTLPLDTVHLTSCIAFDDIAAGLSINRDTLKNLNPHILRWCTPPDTFSTILYLPAGMKKKWNDFYDSLPPQKKVLWCRYPIARGETLESIASKHNVRADALKTINRLTSSRISAGHHLFIPRSDSLLDSSIAYTLPPESEIKMLDLPDYEFAGVVVRHRIRSGDNLGKIARRYHVSIAQLCRWNGVTRRTILRLGRVLVVSRPQPLPATSPAAPATVSVADAATTTHLVQIGDTPFSVSRKYNISIQDLATLNNLDISHPIIRIGQVLKLSATAAVTTEAASPDLKGPSAGSDSLVAAATNPAPAQHNPDSALKIQPTPAKTATLAEKKSKAPEMPADTASQRAGARSSCYHVVATGENLYRISLKYAVPVASLMKANHIADVSLVRTGDSLFIPAAFDVAKPMEGQEVPGIVYYKVKDGDTLWRIASQFGVPIDSLYKNNNLTPDTVLTPGLVIKVVTSGDM